MGMKYLLDTNILSEVAKPRPAPSVLAKLEQYSGQYCTSVTVWHELHYGVQRMVESKRRQQLQDYLDTLDNAGLPILPYEKPAGEWLAQERGRLSKQGIAVALPDGEIAAVAAVNRLTLVTRNTADFSAFRGIEVDDWFQ